MTTDTNLLRQALEALETMDVWLARRHHNGLGLMPSEKQLVADLRIRLERARLERVEQEPAVAVVTECEACFTPDTCRLRGTCDHYSAELLRIADAPQPAPAREPASKAERAHTIVDAGPSPGMSAAFDAHIGAECWTEFSYRQDAALWAAAWKAATRAAQAPAREPIGYITEQAVELLRDGQSHAALLYPSRNGCWTVAIYTAPQPAPAREPLTDEQIDKLPWGPHAGNPMTFAEGLRDFARAIERAHGIGSKT